MPSNNPPNPPAYGGASSLPRDVACPDCGVQAGIPCVGARGKARFSHHQARCEKALGAKGTMRERRQYDVEEPVQHDGQVCPPERGRAIAYEACVQELVRRGRTRDDAEQHAKELLKMYLP